MAQTAMGMRIPRNGNPADTGTCNGSVCLLLNCWLGCCLLLICWLRWTTYASRDLKYTSAGGSSGKRSGRPRWFWSRDVDAQSPGDEGLLAVNAVGMREGQTACGSSIAMVLN